MGNNIVLHTLFHTDWCKKHFVSCWLNEQMPVQFVKPKIHPQYPPKIVRYSNNIVSWECNPKTWETPSC